MSSTLASLSVFLTCFHKYHSRNQRPPPFFSARESLCVIEKVSAVTLPAFHFPAFTSGQLNASKQRMLSTSICTSPQTSSLHTGPGSPSSSPSNVDDSTQSLHLPRSTPSSESSQRSPPALLLGHMVSLRTNTYIPNHRIPFLTCGC